jgi:hypothetical protein
MPTDRVTAPQKSCTHACVQRIKSEYGEMPGLHLTREQMRRLFGCDPDACALAIGVLESSRFLRRTARGAYVRADLGA